MGPQPGEQPGLTHPVEPCELPGSVRGLPGEIPGTPPPQGPRNPPAAGPANRTNLGTNLGRNEQNPVSRLASSLRSPLPRAPDPPIRTPAHLRSPRAPFPSFQSPLCALRCPDPYPPPPRRRVLAPRRSVHVDGVGVGAAEEAFGSSARGSRSRAPALLPRRRRRLRRRRRRRGRRAAAVAGDRLYRSRGQTPHPWRCCRRCRRRQQWRRQRRAAEEGRARTLRDRRPARP
eukprot:gene3016-biopygen6957